MVLLFLIMALCYHSFAVPIGASCLLGSLYCGNDPTAEFLTCDPATKTCLGTYLNNMCDSNHTCSHPPFTVTVLGYVHSCPTGCSKCSNATVCSACVVGYYLVGTSCVALPSNCLSGLTAEVCITCNPGYFQSSYSCSSCISNCLYCLTSVDCLPYGCASGYYYDASALACTAGPANCALPTGPNTCAACSSGYYLYIVSANTTQCKAGPKGCSCIAPLGMCQACNVGYLLNTSTSWTCPPTNTSANICVKMAVSNCISSPDAISCTKCANNYFLNKVCSVPVANCLVAANGTWCSVCNTGYYLQSGVCQPCYLPLPTGGGKPGSGSGPAQTSRCAVCNGPYRTNCLSCVAGYVLVPVTYYGCQSCSDSCLSCDVAGPGKCDNCAAGSFKNGSYCVPCPAGCAACSSSTVCSTCATGYSLVGTNCVLCPSICTGCNGYNSCTGCNAGYFLSSGTCLPCSAPCLTCTTSASNCTSCINTGLATGYLYNSSGNSCVNCSTIGCNNCSTGVGVCSAASAGYSFSTSTLIYQCNIYSCLNCSSNQTCNQCADGNVLNNSLCIPCTGNCSKCQGTPGALTQNVTTNCTQCIGNVTPGFYFNSSANNCTACSAGCTTCTGNPNTCTACNTSQSYSLNTTSNACIQCAGNCTDCSTSGAGKCDTCSSNYILKWDNTACEPYPAGCFVSNLWPDQCTTCDDGYTMGYNGSDPCVACNLGCATCTVIGACLSCLPNYYLNNGTCIACSSNCISCTSSGCTTCANYYHIANSLCVANLDPKCISSSDGTTAHCTACSVGYVVSPIDGKCLACAGTNVATCLPPPLDSNGALIAGANTKTTSCVVGSYMTDDCSSLVNNCTTPSCPNTCSKCDAGFYLSTPSYLCNQCMTGCNACTSSTTCTSCYPGYYYVTTPSISCTKCASQCSTCTSTGCSTCASGFKMIGSTCTACTSSNSANECNCPLGSFWNNNTALCANCPTGCGVCLNSTNCTICLSNYYMDIGGFACKPPGDPNCALVLSGPSSNIGVCTSCQLSTFYDSVNNLCANCNSYINNCSICTSSSSCSLCYSGFYGS